MRIKFYLTLGWLILFFPSGTVWATTAYTVSATVPAATGVSVVVDSVNATGTPVFTPISGNALSFDAGGGMVFNSTYNIYYPSVYYAINVSTTGGGFALPITTLTYVEGNNPNSGSATQGGLGTKTTATYALEAGSVESILPMGKLRLIDLTGTVGQEVYTALVSDTYLRVYVGVWTGSTTAPADPSNGQPFSNADAPGKYTGTLTVTTTLV